MCGFAFVCMYVCASYTHLLPLEQIVKTTEHNE